MSAQMAIVSRVAWIRYDNAVVLELNMVVLELKDAFPLVHACTIGCDAPCQRPAFCPVVGEGIAIRSVSIHPSTASTLRKGLEKW